jgi:hypothetical protein
LAIIDRQLLKNSKTTFDACRHSSTMKRKNKKTKKMSTITISDKQIRVKGGMVVLSLAEYERLLFEIQKANAPVEYLSPKEAVRLDRVMKKALADHKAGKTIRLSSLSSLMDLR